MFYYQVDFYDSDCERRQESGVLCAKHYGEAAHRVVDYYHGSQNIVSIYIEEWMDILTEDEVIKGFEKADVKD